MIKKALPFIWFTVMPLLVSSTLGYGLYEYMDQITFNWFVYIGFYLFASVLMGFALVPTTFMAVLTGFLGGWKLLPLMIISYVLASLLGYKLGQLTDRNFLIALIKSFKKGEGILNKIGTQSPLFIFSCRLSPVLPFGITNVSLSIIGVRLKEFLLYGTLGMLPRTILAVWLGVEADSFMTAFEGGGDLPIFQIGSIVLIILSTSFLVKLFVGKEK